MGESASPATAARLTRWWARLYTVGLPREQRDRRLAELESDLWESLADRAGAREIVERTVRERRTPVVVIHYIEEHLIRNGRLDEAAALMLRDPDDYPLAPQLLDALATALIDERGEAAAIDFLTRILHAFPDDETAQRILMELGGEPSANAQQPEDSTYDLDRIVQIEGRVFRFMLPDGGEVCSAVHSSAAGARGALSRHAESAGVRPSIPYRPWRET